MLYMLGKQTESPRNWYQIYKESKTETILLVCRFVDSTLDKLLLLLMYKCHQMYQLYAEFNFIMFYKYPPINLLL